MADLQQQQQQQDQLFRPPPATASQRRYGGRGGGGSRGGGGEIVEVQGGHIVRSTGRKDRHSKVCTAKGPRDRRVRLSAHTAIQFYDVQDRLGYDRPSKAVDWLMKNAQSAIDELAELPPWHPTNTTTTVAVPTTTSSNPSPPPPPPPDDHEEAHYSFATGCGGGSSILPPSLDSDSIADTIKSFFPMPGTPATSSSYQNFPPPDLLSRTSSHAQDLRLSLQSFQEPPLFHHHHQQQSPPSPPPTHHQSLFAAAALPFDAASTSWSEQTQQRIFPWNMADAGGCGGGGGAYVFNMPPQPQAVPLHSLLGQSQLFTQRGPLQSSNSPSVRAWAAAAADHGPVAAEHATVLHPSAFAFGSGGAASFAGFHIPARIQGDNEEHDGGRSSKPSSATSASRH